MEYNSVKRGLEKGATILSIVLSSAGIIGGLYLFIAGCMLANRYYEFGGSYIGLGIFILALSIVELILACILVKNPYNNGVLKNMNGSRIAFVIFAFLFGNLISFGLEIAVLCLKDFKNKKSGTKTSQEYVMAEKLKELKRLKELCVIDEETYKKAVSKLIENA